MLFEQNVADYSNMVMFKRFYLEDIRNKCRAMKFVDLFKNPKIIKDYILLKPKYQMLKMLRKHPKLIEFLIRDLKTKDYGFGRKDDNI